MNRKNTKEGTLSDNANLLQIRVAIINEQRETNDPITIKAKELGLSPDDYCRKASGKLFAKLQMLFNEGVRGILDNGKVKRIEAYVPGQGFKMVKPIVEKDKMYFVLQQRSNRRKEVRIAANESFPSLQLCDSDFSSYLK
jgi:hypothetical protein